MCAQDEDTTTFLMVPADTPYLLPRALCAAQDLGFGASSLRISFTSSWLRRGLRPPDMQSFPCFLAWSVFSLAEQYSRLLTQLFSLFESMWLTNGLFSGGPPSNDPMTRRCTANSLPLRCTLAYPLVDTHGFNTTPALKDGFPLCRTVLSRLLTRPRSLTSYSPSKLTTGFQISLSISHLSSGICSLFSGAASWATSAFSETARWPFGSAPQERRPVGQPMPGVSPA